MLSKKLYDYTTGELNSLTPKEITSFTYANSGWKDPLVSVNGEEFTYDENGNLLIVHCASGANNVVITGLEGFTSIGRPLYYGE